MFKLTLLTALVAGAMGLGQRALGAIFTQSVTSGSLMRVTDAARCEPIAIVDGSLVDYEPLYDIAHTALNQFAAIYVQSVALTNVTVSGVQIINRLGSLNPNRSGSAAIEGSVVAAMEQHQQELMQESEGPVLSQMHYDEPNYGFEGDGLVPVEQMIASTEANNAARGARGAKDESGGTTAQRAGASSLRDSLKDLPELAVGKLIEITLREGKEEYKIPVTIRLAPVLAKSEVLIDAAVSRFGNEQSSLTRRAGWKSGRLSLIKDGLLCLDLFRQHRKLLVQDTDGIYAAMTPQKSSGMLATVVTGRPSLAMASNVMIISKESAQAIEAKLGGSFESQKFRETMFARTGIMFLAIVDTSWDSVSFFYDTIAHKLTVPVAKLVTSSKKNGPDINDVLRALTAGNAPRNL